MQGFKDFLAESSLSRIWRHTQNHMCGGITAFRAERTRKENVALNREISAYLVRKGYGVTRIMGNYIENFGTDNAKEVGEESFFVVDLNDTGKLEDELVKLGRKYGQDSVLIVPKGGKDAYLRGTLKGGFPGLGQTLKVGAGKFGKAAGEFLSRINGRAFAFESVEYPKTRNGIWAMSKLAEAAENRLDEQDD